MRRKQARYAKRVEVDGRLIYPNPPGGHGQFTVYNEYGCRCDECRAANARRQCSRRYSFTSQQARYAERVEIDGQMVHPKPWGGHGSRTAYNNCGCRCVECRSQQASRKTAS